MDKSLKDLMKKQAKAKKKAARLKTPEAHRMCNRLVAEVWVAVNKAKKKWVRTCKKLDLLDWRQVWQLINALTVAGETRNPNCLMTPKGQKASEVKCA